MNEYESVAVVTEISAVSRVAVKIKDNFYTVEYSEKRTVPDVDGVDIDLERKLMWDAVNKSVDEQVEEIVKSFK